MADESQDLLPIRMKMQLPNQLFLTRPLREFQAITLSHLGFDEEEIEEIGLVATEAVNNSFEHASDRRLHEVEVEIYIDRDKWVFTVRDEGQGKLSQEQFEFGGKGPPDHLDDRGRGTFLISSFSDQVVVRPLDGGGTELEVTRYRKGTA